MRDNSPHSRKSHPSFVIRHLQPGTHYSMRGPLIGGKEAAQNAAPPAFPFYRAETKSKVKKTAAFSPLAASLPH